MAGATHPVVRILGILEDVFGTVRTVADQAILICLSFHMGIVAVKTCRPYAVFVSMAPGTSHFCIMFAGMSRKLLAFRLPVTYFTRDNGLAGLCLDLLRDGFKRDVLW